MAMTINNVKTLESFASIFNLGFTDGHFIRAINSHHDSLHSPNQSVSRASVKHFVFHRSGVRMPFEFNN
jgi:hypothetical protein